MRNSILYLQLHAADDKKRFKGVEAGQPVTICHQFKMFAKAGK